MSDADNYGEFDMPEQEEAEARASGTPLNEPKTHAVQRYEPPPNVVPITPQDARNTSIATMLDAAYQKASTLQLTADEAKELAADFPDEAFELGAGGDKSLLYLSHVYLRQRLNSVLGVGAAVPIRRREWSEEFTYFKDRQEKHAARVYVEMVLLVRGCVVGEAIADAIFYKDNAMDSYADTLEKAKSNAFRRCCKEFGVGLQPWMKGFCEAWKQRNNAFRNVRQPAPVRTSPPPAQNAPQANVERKPAAPADVLPKGASEKTRDWAWNALTAQFDTEFIMLFAEKRGWLDEASTWKLEYVPTSKQALAALADEIRATLPQEPPQQSGGDDLPSDWADVIFSISPKGVKKADWLAQGVTLGQLYRGSAEDKKKLFGYAKSWNPEPWIGNDGRKNPVSREDADCRVGMDLFLEWRAQKGESDAND